MVRDPQIPPMPPLREWQPRVMLREPQFRLVEPPIQGRERVVEDVGRSRQASGNDEPKDEESDPQASPGDQDMVYAPKSAWSPWL